jgi:uncharacterized protein (DUF2342 family)
LNESAVRWKPAAAGAPGHRGSVEAVAVLSDLAQSVLAQSDPTGFSSPVGRLVVLAALVASLVVLLRWWWQQRKR